MVVPAANSDWTHLGGTGPQPVLVHSSQAACGLILTHGHRFANLTLKIVPYIGIKRMPCLKVPK